MKPESHIVIENLSKSFAASGEILHDININITKGDFVVLLGPSGSGKSTLLRLIAGLEAASSGTIKVSQKNNFDKGFVFQEAHLMPWRTLRENVELPLKLMKVASSECKKKSLNALTQVALEAAEALFPEELSGGMKMRASLARALVTEPGLLLLDNLLQP